jgi:P4 family phage/plasmid primase-like protien
MTQTSERRPDRMPDAEQNSRNTNTPSVPAGSEITRYLTGLYGTEPQGALQVCSAGDWIGRVFTGPDRIEEAARYAAELDARGVAGVYHRGTTLKRQPEARGTNLDSRHIYMFALDLDVAGEGHKDKKLPNPPDEATVLDLLAKAGLPAPTAWISSGGGFYGQWRLIEPVDVRQDEDRAEAERWYHALAKHAKETFKAEGYNLDSCHDLARVWRVPGTTNRKREPHIQAEVRYEDGPRYSVAELAAVVPTVAAADDADPFDVATERTPWTRGQAENEVAKSLARVRTTDTAINTTCGGLIRRVGRFIPGLMTWEEAERRCLEAMLANPNHSDAWNAANGLKWNMASLVAMSLGNGMADPFVVLADTSASDMAAEAEPEDRYTDAQMSGRLSREVLAGRYVYTKGMGWLRWTGQRWADEADEVIHEDTRKWTLAGYLAAVETWKRAAAAGATDKPIHEDPDVLGWSRVQALGRIQSMVKLARGIVMRDAAEFDTDPDLLNTPTGVVDLRTGQVMPHDPARLITKVTAVGYVPGAESPALKAALEAVPDDARDWLQLRLGEAITGHSGEQMVLLTGGGRNGKTLLMGSAFRTLGGYAAKVPSTLLLKTRQTGGATPERMTLRGIRLAYMEETPEDGYLDSAVVKDLLDAEEIEGRHLYRDIVSWRPTHSLFLNTNHAPTMKDTGDGAWRRLTRLDFPYRFRKTGEPLEREMDRHGDPHLKAALGGTRDGQEALLAWLVAGAIRCYATGSVEEAGPDPASVREAVQRWREESDALLLFIRDVLTFDTDAWVTNADLFRAYARWAKDNHMEGMASRTFFKRLEVHSALTNRVGRTQRRTSASPPSRPDDLLVDGLLQPLPARPEGWAGLAFQGSDQEE